MMVLKWLGYKLSYCTSDVYSFHYILILSFQPKGGDHCLLCRMDTLVTKIVAFNAETFSNFSVPVAVESLVTESLYACGDPLFKTS